MAGKIGSALALCLLSVLWGVSTALADEDVDPFERLVSECGPSTTLHRLDENSSKWLALPAGVYIVWLWTHEDELSTDNLGFWSIGIDGAKDRIWEAVGWRNISSNSGFEAYGKHGAFFTAPGGAALYWLSDAQLTDYVLEIRAPGICGEPSIEQIDSSQGESEDDIEQESLPLRPSSDYRPVTSEWVVSQVSELLSYGAEADAFTDRVRTDVRMSGPAGKLTLHAVCFEGGTAGLGIGLNGFIRPERDSDFPTELEVIWRLDDGPVERETLDVEFLGDTPAVFFRSEGFGFSGDWPSTFEGGELVVRINYRGVQQDSFDMTTFATTSVHGNLVHCGSY